MPKSTSAPARGGNGRPAKTAAGNGRSAKATSNGSAADRSARDRRYDAIVIGGGHNGLVNGAYLAKAGLKTLILERRHLVGGAAIGSQLRNLDKKVLHDAVRLLTGSAADFLDDYFESDILKGYLASSSIIGTKV